jgi:hypothetical protein
MKTNIFIISLSFLLRMNNDSHKHCTQIKTHFTLKTFFFPKIVLWNTIAGPDRPQMTIWRMHISCRVTKATNTLRICNSYCFSIPTMVERTRLNVTLYVHCLSFFRFSFLFLIYRVLRLILQENTTHYTSCLYIYTAWYKYEQQTK